MVTISCQAPTSTLVRLQPPENQLYFSKTPILDLGALTPKDFNPSYFWGINPKDSNPSYFWGTSPKKSYPSWFWGTSPKDSYPSCFWGTNPKDSNPVKALFIIMFYSQNSSLLSSIYLQIHCSLQTTVSMTTLSSYGWLFIALHTTHT